MPSWVQVRYAEQVEGGNRVAGWRQDQVKPIPADAVLHVRLEGGLLETEGTWRAWFVRVGYAILREVDERDYFSKKAAKWIRARGLSDLVLMMIEIGRPFGDVFAQMGYLIAPMLGSGDSGWVGFLGSLGDERGLEQFISDLNGEGGRS